MTQGTRYQVQGSPVEQGSVRSFRGLDPVTGLPVLIYQFTGEPRLKVGSLQSDYIPGILSVKYNGKQGIVVAASTREHAPLKSRVEEHESLRLLTDTARALRDAAAAGVIHGDIKPQRFLKGAKGYLLEGYGARWDDATAEYRAPDFAGGSLETDLYSWAKAVRVSTKGLSKEAEDLLKRCLVADPQARPSAAEVAKSAEAFATPAPAPSAPAPLDTKSTSFDFDFDMDGDTPPTPVTAPSKRAVAEEAPAEEKGGGFSFDFDVAPAAVSSSPSGGHAASFDDPDPLLVNTDPGTRAKGAVAAPPPRAAAPVSAPSLKDTPAFVKDLPPGAVYRAGNDAPPPPPLHYNPKTTAYDQTPPPYRPQPHNGTILRVILITALVLGMGALGYVAISRQQESTRIDTNPNVTGTRFIIDVNINPDSLRLVPVLVVSSPPNSAFRPGDEIGTIVQVPGKIVLDQPGDWQLRARFQERLSDPVSFRVPTTAPVTFTIPIPPAN